MLDSNPPSLSLLSWWVLDILDIFGSSPNYFQGIISELLNSWKKLMNT